MQRTEDTQIGKGEGYSLIKARQQKQALLAGGGNNAISDTAW